MHDVDQSGRADDTPSTPPPVTSAGPAPAAPETPRSEPAIDPLAEAVHAAAIWGDESPAADFADALVEPQGPPVLRGLRIWLVMIGVLGVSGVLLGQAEMALLVTLAGAFVAAHAADRDPIYRPLHLLLTGVLVAGSALTFGAIAVWLATQRGPGPLRPLASGMAGGAAVLSILTAWRPLSDGMASAVFRTLHPNHVTRLGGRVVLFVMLFLIPGWAAFPSLIDIAAERGEPLLDNGQLVSGLLGLVVLALGGIGFMVRRDARASLERLGLRVPRLAHLVVMVIGVAVLYLLNLGVESIQRTFFPALWQHDDRINRLMAGGLGTGSLILLGVSAGMGEELAIRGALQPRLGLIFTAIVFASLHVHYSWIGIATILLLGIALGVIRDRTSTTVAILVHSAYDFLAVVTNGGPRGH
jgi:hypothetical protein